MSLCVAALFACVRYTSASVVTCGLHAIALLPACARPAPARLAPVVVVAPGAPIYAPAEDDAEVARRRVLELLDAGALAAAAAELSGQRTPMALAIAKASVKPSALANVLAHEIRELPAPTAPRTVEKLGGTVIPTPHAFTQELAVAAGTSYSDGVASSSGEPPPASVPPRLVDRSLTLMRPADGRWLLHYERRFVAVLGGRVGATPALFDFGELGVRSADLSGDLLVVNVERPHAGPTLLGLDLETGAVRWRADELVEHFVITAAAIVAVEGEAPATSIVTLSRETGQRLARRSALPVRGELLAADGTLHYVPRSQVHPGAVRGEVIDLKIAMTPRPPPPEPGPAPEPLRLDARSLSKAQTEARLRAWRQLDEGDARGAVLTLRKGQVGDLGSSLLAEAAFVTLEAQRKAAAEVIVKKGAVKPNQIPVGRAPIPRPRAHRLKVVSTKTISMDRIWAELPPPSDDDLFPPSYVPEKLASRGRNVDASHVDRDSRVDVYWGYGQDAWTVLFRHGALVGTIEQRYEARASGAVGDVVVSINNFHGTMLLEANDAKTGAFYYRSADPLADQAFVIEDGYVIASGLQGASMDIVLLEADTGKLVDRAYLTGSSFPFLVMRKDEKIIAVSERTSAVVELQ
ncbi:MAG: hypothetical protein U0270_40725 [Labilithrix sp.]